MRNELTTTNDLMSADFLGKFFLSISDGATATQRTYKSCLRSFYEWLLNQQDGQHPTQDTIQRYKVELQDAGKKPATVHLYMTVVRKFFEFTDNRGCYPNIAKPIKAGKVNKESTKYYFEPDQVKAIMAKINDSDEKGLRDKALLDLLFNCGLRTIEASRAQVKDIVLIGSQYRLLIQGKGHRDKDDDVRLPAQTRAIIMRYLASRGIDAKTAETCDEPLFTSTTTASKGKAITTRTIRRICKQAFVNAGFDDPHFSAHSTRHTSAIISLKSNGGNVYKTQQFLRHKSPATTEIYTHQLGKLDNDSADVIANILH